LNRSARSPACWILSGTSRKPPTVGTDQAVKQGIATTAATITAAALVMVGVFAVFITLSFLDFKDSGSASRPPF
jgi:uncharacterized membrane protein YdfJ with MMPL/SSD domain